MVRKILLFCVLISINVCAYALPKILIIGDSLAAGYGIDIQRGWVALLQEQVQHRYEVINAGITGDTTSNGLARLPEALRLHQPKVVVIELGGNDGLRGIPVPIIKSNLEKMIKLAKKQAEHVIVVGVRIPPNYGPQYTQQFQSIFINLGKQYSIPVIPLLLDKIDDQARLMQNDRVHPTEEAQPIIFNNVWTVLKKYL